MVMSGSGVPSAIVKASGASIPKELTDLWRAAGWVLEDMATVDSHHLVLVFSVQYASSLARRGVPKRLMKHSDVEKHAPYKAKCLKLATLRHYRERHRGLEGTWDPMEGRSRLESTLEEMCRRHGVRAMPRGANLVATTVTYQTDDTSLIYCASGMGADVSRHEHWKVASRIREVPRFGLLLGAEFARQRDTRRHAAVTGLDRLVAAAVEGSGPASVVHVHHGPVVYSDHAGEIVFGKIPEHARGLAAHFFKRKDFEYQNEYRFVLSASGGRPIEDEFYLRITADLRSVFERA